MNLLEILVFSAVMWLGIYILARDGRDALLRSAGLGIIAYGVALALLFVARLEAAPQFLNRLFWAALVAPPYFWGETIIRMAGDTLPYRRFLLTLHKRALALLLAALLFFLVLGQSLWTAGNQLPEPAGLWAVFGANLLPLLSLLFAAPHIWQNRASAGRFSAVATATIFFTLGAGLLIFPFEWLPQTWVILAIALDFELLGLSIIQYDAFETGEKMLPDFLRALVFGLVLAALFGSQVGFVIALSTGFTYFMSLLLHAIIVLAFVVAIFSDPIQDQIEKIVFRNQPALQSQRAALRNESRARTRLDAGLDPAGLDVETFSRLTRKALSHFGDLPKLAANPLTNIALIDRRLQPDGRSGNTLERARELKIILTESILRLKPSSDAHFGDTDEWRFFNALYFPYVAGLRPYSRRASYENLDEDQRMAMDWFRSQVPERTLYNWQKTAAGLVAQDIIERNNAHL